MAVKMPVPGRPDALFVVFSDADRNVLDTSDVWHAGCDSICKETRRKAWKIYMANSSGGIFTLTQLIGIQAHTAFGSRERKIISKLLTGE